MSHVASNLSMGKPPAPMTAHRAALARVTPCSVAAPVAARGPSAIFRISTAAAGLAPAITRICAAVARLSGASA